MSDQASEALWERVRSASIAAEILDGALGVALAVPVHPVQPGRVPEGQPTALAG